MSRCNPDVCSRSLATSVPSSSRPPGVLAILTCSLSRTLPRLCFGSNSHARRRPSKAFPPVPGFGLPLRISKPARTRQRAEILRRTLRECFSVGCRLGSGDLSLRVAPRQMGTKGKNMNLNRLKLISFLGSEPETTYTPSGNAVATLSPLRPRRPGRRTMSARNAPNGTESRLGPSWPNMLRASRRARTSASKANCAAASTNRLRREGRHLRNRRLFDREPTAGSTDLDVGDRIGSGYGPSR